MDQNYANLQGNKKVYDKLQESKKIVEECNKKIAEINEAVESLENAIKINEDKNVTKEQIEKLQAEIEVQEKASKLFENNNSEIANDIQERRKLLADLQASSLVNETALSAYKSKKTDLLIQAAELSGKKQLALEMIENIAEIYEEKAERVNEKIEEKEQNKEAKEDAAATLSPLVTRYSELKNRYERLNSFGDIISDKKLAEKKAIAEEMEEIRETFGSLMPNFNKKLLETLKIETEFEIDKRRSEMSIKRQETIRNTYEKLAKEATDFLKENDYIYAEQIKFYDDKKEEKAEVKEEKFEEPKVESFDLPAAAPWGLENDKKEATFGLKEELKEHKMPEIKQDLKKDFENEYGFLFGDNIKNEKVEEKELPSFPKTEESEKVEEKTEEPKAPIDVFESAIAGEPRYSDDSIEPAEVEKEETKEEKKEENKQSYKNNPRFSKFNQAILLNATKAEIKAKVKKKVKKGKKENFFKRMLKKIDGYFFEPITDEELSNNEIENNVEKGGRTR